jgi:uncharacterized damage-inducible protein DinB
MPSWLAGNLDGEYAHKRSSTIFEGLPPAAAGQRVPALPYTIWQVLQHMIWWQDWWLARLAGDRPENPPDLAVTWPTTEAPPDAVALHEAVRHFQHGVKRAQAYAAGDPDAPVAADPPGPAGAELVQIASHNSYHAGQVVLMRRLLGCWPMPR